MEKLYIVTETCQATAETTYHVEADSPDEAEALVRSGNIGAADEEVYGHQHAEYEVEEDGEDD